MEFNWDNYNVSKMHVDPKRVEGVVVEYVSSTISETIDKIQKLYPDIYVFYSEDEYDRHECYIKDFKETCELNLDIATQYYIYSPDFTSVYIISDNLETY